MTDNITVTVPHNPELLKAAAEFLTQCATIDASPLMENQPATKVEANENNSEVDIVDLPTGDGLDIEGLPWDERIHSSNHKKTAKRKWQKRKGVDDALVIAVTAELKGGVTPDVQPKGQFAVEPALVAPVAPVAPIEPAPVAVAVEPAPVAVAVEPAPVAPVHFAHLIQLWTSNSTGATPRLNVTHLTPLLQQHGLASLGDLADENLPDRDAKIAAIHAGLNTCLM